MAIADLDITKEDFENGAFADLSQSVVRTPKVKTSSNVSGSPTYADGTVETISAVFLRRNENFDWAKEGLFENGDAFMQVKQDQALVKEDYIAVGGETFRVNTIIPRQIGGVAMFKSCNLFFVE